jgi:hypothetical protein
MALPSRHLYLKQHSALPFDFQQPAGRLVQVERPFNIAHRPYSFAPGGPVVRKLLTFGIRERRLDARDVEEVQGHDGVNAQYRALFLIQHWRLLFIERQRLGTKRRLFAQQPSGQTNLTAVINRS